MDPPTTQIEKYPMPPFTNPPLQLSPALRGRVKVVPSKKSRLVMIQAAAASLFVVSTCVATGRHNSNNRQHALVHTSRAREVRTVAVGCGYTRASVHHTSTCKGMAESASLGAVCGGS